MLSVYLFLSTRLHRDDRGATAVEYGLMVALIAAVIVGIVGTLGGQLDAAFCDVVTKLDAVTGVGDTC